MLTRLSRKQPPQLRNEASLNCVSLRSELDCELRCEAVQHGRKLARFREKTNKRGDAVGRPNCLSSLLSDPNANFSVEIWRRSNIRRAATSALTFMTFS
jgi:hypothetical protein